MTFFHFLLAAFLACVSGGIIATPAGTVLVGGDENVQLHPSAHYDFELLDGDGGINIVALEGLLIAIAVVFCA
jgi:hypothetical protein